METSEIKVGDRIRIEFMNDPVPVPPGTIGEVRMIDSLGTIHVRWENGRSLGVIPGEDRFSKVVK
jgi:hypothetical protein